MKIHEEINNIETICIDKNTYSKIRICQKINNDKLIEKYPYLKNKVVMKGSKYFLRNIFRDGPVLYNTKNQYDFALKKTIKYLTSIVKNIKGDFGYIKLNISNENKIKLLKAGYINNSFEECLFLFIAEKENLPWQSIQAGEKHINCFKNGYNNFEFIDPNLKCLDKLIHYRIVFLPNGKLFYSKNINNDKPNSFCKRWNAVYDLKIQYMKSLNYW